MKINVLGTGTSVGIPSIGKLGWEKCNPDNPKIGVKDVQLQLKIIIHEFS